MSFQDILSDYAFTASKNSPDGHISTQLPGRLNGIADAYRHILGAAEIARKAGEVWAGILGSTNEFGSTDPDSVMDLHNNLIGIHIGNYVNTNNGDWNDVVNLTQEYFEKSLDGFVPSDLTSSNASWDQTSYGNIVLTQNIALDNGLVLQGLSVLEVSSWSNNPLDPNGNGTTDRLSNNDSNWPDSNGTWLNNFIPQTYNYNGNYSLSTPVVILGNGHFTEINGKITYITDQASGLTHSQIMSHMGSQFSAIANASTNQSVAAFSDVEITIDHNGVLKDYHIHVGSDGSDSYDLSEDFHIIEEENTGGNDSISYSVLAGTDGVNVDLGVGSTYVGNVLGQPKDIFTNIENVTGTNNDDTLWGTNHNNELEGRDGADGVRGFQGDDTIDGGDGNNTIRGGVGADSIVSGAGDDYIYAQDLLYDVDVDFDVITSGAGNDTLVASGNDLLNAGAGDDWLRSFGGNNTLKGGAGVDVYNAKKGDVIIDIDGGSVNGIDKVYGKEHIQAGAVTFAFSYSGGLKVYLGYNPTADNYFTIANYINDGRWGFEIAAQNLKPYNKYIRTGVNGENPPTNDLHPEGSTTPLGSPTSGTSSPSASNPTLGYDAGGRHEYGYTNSENYLIASEGFDTMEGGVVSDIYGWAVGNHNDEIIESGGTTDRIVLAGLNAGDVTAERIGDDVRIRALTSNETLTVKGHFLGSHREVETVEYADGSTLNLAVAANGMSDINETLNGTSSAETLSGLGGDDFIVGNNGADTIEGGLDDDTLKGGAHDDSYIWRAGDGNDVIQESGSHDGGNDTLELKGGITLADLDIYGVASHDVQIVYLPTGETITLTDQADGRDVETLVFDDGSTHTIAGVAWRGDVGNDILYGSLLDDSLSGFTGDDSLYGRNGADTLEGGTGDDYLKGEAHDDTYVWKLGDGSDFIVESGSHDGGNDTLKLGAGISLADLDIYGTMGYDLVITHISSGATITVDEHFDGHDVETLLFDDNSTLDLNLVNTFKGSAGNDYLIGSSAGNNMLGGTGDDTLLGYKGDDSYVWQSGDGNDLIQESNTSSSGDDTLRITGGVVEADLAFSQASDDLVITLTATGETITVENQLHADTDYHVETLLFDNGSTLELDKLFAPTVDGTSGNDSIQSTSAHEILNGYAGDDTLWSMAGEDTLIGGTGNDNLWGSADDDTYIWASGDGNDIIWETYNVVGGDDTLLMTGGIVAADVTFADSGNHLIITHTPTGETITINYQNHSDPDYHVETLLFDNGSSMDLLGV